MQIKPQFKEYKEISRTPLNIKDDRGVEYDFVHFSAKTETSPGMLRDGDGDCGKHYSNYASYQTETCLVDGYAVLSREIEKHSNGATSYDETMFWKYPHEMRVIEIDGLTLEEYMDGTNSFFTGEITMNTRFYIKKK